MARRWTTEEETHYRKELVDLYVVQNKTIKEAGEILGISEKTVFERMQRLGVASHPELKTRYCNRTQRVTIPEVRTEKLAEFFGIMLGDGHISHFQTMVTLGTKELEYVEYVADLMHELFNTRPKISCRKNGYRDVYLGSVALTKWLKDNGLVSNKVAAQVDIPSWVRDRHEWMGAVLRGFFDTDGSIYRLRFGRQISLTNHSLPLLRSLRELLIELQYRPSAVSAYKVYLTRRNDIDRFFAEILPANAKHLRRFQLFSST